MAVSETFFPLGDHTQRNDLTVVRTLTPPAGYANESLKIKMQCQTQNVRYTVDGTDPTATLGFRIVAGNAAIIEGVSPGSIGTVVKVIQEAATAVLDFQWGQ